METQFYSLEAIAKNNGKNGANTWIIIRDNVYDVTKYLEEHPGGSDLIQEWAGKDATKAFDEFGHSGDAKKTLKTFKIAEVVEDERRKKTNKKLENNVKIVEENDKTNGSRRSCLAVITCGLCA